MCESLGAGFALDGSAMEMDWSFWKCKWLTDVPHTELGSL